MRAKHITTNDHSLFDVEDKVKKLIYYTDSKILKGLLSIEKDHKCKKKVKELHKLNNTISVYRKRDRNRTYTIFCGTFSVGKSSAINSILKLWGTDYERNTGTQVTDQSVTFICNKEDGNNISKNFNINSNTPIKIQVISNNEITDNITVLDTPGSGETEFLEELVKDFIPSCDNIVYFLNPTGFDTIDENILKYLVKSSNDLPIVFIITHCDNHFKFKKLKSINNDNFDIEAFNNIVDTMRSRMLKTGLNNKIITNAKFYPLANDAEEGYFGLEDIILEINAMSKNDRSSKEYSHENKINLFIDRFEDISSWFYKRSNSKYNDLKDYRKTLTNNINKYDNILIKLAENLVPAWTESKSSINNVHYTMDDIEPIDFYDNFLSSSRPYKILLNEDEDIDLLREKYIEKIIEVTNIVTNTILSNMSEEIVNNKTLTIKKLEEIVHQETVDLEKNYIDKTSRIINEHLRSIITSLKTSNEHQLKETNSALSSLKSSITRYEKNLVNDNSHTVISKSIHMMVSKFDDSVSELYSNLDFVVDGTLVNKALVLFTNLGLAGKFNKAKEGFKKEDQDKHIKKLKSKIFNFNLDEVDKYESYLTEKSKELKIIINNIDEHSKVDEELFDNEIKKITSDFDIIRNSMLEIIKSNSLIFKEEYSNLIRNEISSVIGFNSMKKAQYQRVASKIALFCIIIPLSVIPIYALIFREDAIKFLESISDVQTLLISAINFEMKNTFIVILLVSILAGLITNAVTTFFKNRTSKLHTSAIGLSSKVLFRTELGVSDISSTKFTSLDMKRKISDFEDSINSNSEYKPFNSKVKKHYLLYRGIINDCGKKFYSLQKYFMQHIEEPRTMFRYVEKYSDKLKIKALQEPLEIVASTLHEAEDITENLSNCTFKKLKIKSNARCKESV